MINYRSVDLSETWEIKTRRRNKLDIRLRILHQETVYQFIYFHLINSFVSCLLATIICDLFSLLLILFLAHTNITHITIVTIVEFSIKKFILI